MKKLLENLRKILVILQLLASLGLVKGEDAKKVDKAVEDIDKMEA